MSENHNFIHNDGGFNLSRRRFVKGLALGGAFTGLGFGGSVFAVTMKQARPLALRGTEFDLTLAEQAVNFTGAPRVATTVNGSLPAPLLRWRVGDTVTLRVTNLLPQTSSIHWHGIILPSAMDGVPGIANDFQGIRPGETFTYRFPVTQSGTYWYHSHSGFQEQTGLYGPIVIDPREPDPVEYDRDYVVMLSDWTDEDPNDVYRKLKKLSHYYNFNERTHADLMRDIETKGLEATWNDRKMWNQMRMSQRDLSDVTGYTYTFLTNGRTPADGWSGLFRKGEKVRLRFINGSAMTFFDVRIPGLKMTVVAADGQNLEPVTVDEFRLGVAETYDVIVEPMHDMAYTIFAQDIARTGFARGTLTPDLVMTAEIPEMDPVPDLGHNDMGMGMHGMGHVGHDMSKMNHTQDQMPDGQMMSGMDHSQHQMSEGAAMAGMDYSQHQMTMNGGVDRSMLKPNPSDFTAGPVTHAKTEYGPHVDMRADAAQYRLDDPGVGLRNNGRRVLTYADLRNLQVSPDLREPDRDIELHLTGNMGRYMWSIDGIKHADAEPLRWKLGERLRITFVNDTMMNHPMHLHGMWSDLETGDNNFLPRKHTVVVQPGSRISYRVTVDAEGGWAYHCHLLYHMLGMFRTVIVS
ncbi:MAG: copper resistance system multicopper oxidase [Candidatus Thiodiazotropha lotti]|uniref:Copper resistance system multicopper oxidase n=1 Tax=Candidatus Thiodiazotropha lotti TaxID=2792787 RepID=A0A9E4K0R4_9GAMM|nr:copper resistance system multicopper oxidase [Candidatus Thiodiazotropha weberae]MCG7937491.1 copper resistance system multicopper oxidase [Candidatus Thiodiazotropha lotti]MCW4201957.1 copper resistance system multicopper oxidase [Candidatus Thiodiazotropha lotti]